MTFSDQFSLSVSLSARPFTEPICCVRALINHTAISSVRVALKVLRVHESAPQVHQNANSAQIKVVINITQFPVQTHWSFHELSLSFSRWWVSGERKTFLLGVLVIIAKVEEKQKQPTDGANGVWLGFDLNENNFLYRINKQIIPFCLMGAMLSHRFALSPSYLCIC